jgi:anti-anti-sigma regulatory factor
MRLRKKEKRSKASSRATVGRPPLDNWMFVTSSAGALWIQPTGPTLGHEELGELLGRLQSGRKGTHPREIVLDLSRVEKLGRHWTLVLAMLIRFARSGGCRGRIVALHGQPADVARLYRLNRELECLMPADPRRCGDDARRIVA